jgi:hypothetical protein
MQFRVFAYVALALLATACDILDQRSSDEFPDAGPGGPDSSFAGVGQAIPFGEFKPAESDFGLPYTGAVTPASRSGLAAALRSAQEAKTRLVINLAGGRRNYTNPDGTLNLELWKRRIDQYRDVDFAPYVTEGLVLAHSLVDEPRWPGNWGGRAISFEEIEEMARYSKTIWPSLPTTVSGETRPGLLRGFEWHYLDVAWAQWTGPLYGSGASQSLEEYRNESVAYAKELGLGLILGLNVLDGGDGSSGIPGAVQGHWRMTGAELQQAGVVLAQTPYACALFIWRHDPEYERRPDIRAAMDTIALAAASRGGTSCVRHPTSGDTNPPGGTGGSSDSSGAP